MTELKSTFDIRKQEVDVSRRSLPLLSDFDCLNLRQAPSESFGPAESGGKKGLDEFPCERGTNDFTT
jgi:hypothetical protein